MSEEALAITDIAVRLSGASEAVLPAPNTSDDGHDDVIAHATMLRTRADCVMETSIALIRHSFVTMGRASGSVNVAREFYEELLVVFDRLSASLKQGVRARDADTQQSLTKAADDHDALATLLDAGVAMSKDLRTNAHLVLASLASLAKLSDSVDGSGARLCVPVSTLVPGTLAFMSTVWCELPDGVVSTVTGRGMKSFVKGAAGATRNLVLVYPRVFNGALAEYVKPDDVCLMLKADAGSLIDVHLTVERIADGGFQLAYSVSADVANQLKVSVTVCGVAIGADMTVQSGYDAINGTNHVTSYDVGASNFSMAVNDDGSVIAVSYVDVHQVHVFRLTPSFERTCVIGRKGTGPAEFMELRRLCFTSADTVLVCDSGNGRVQQLTVAGEYLSSFAVKAPYSITVHGDMIAVGCWDGSIEMHSLATGELICRFGSRGDGPGQIGGHATGIGFTLDGMHLLVAEYSNLRMSLFTVNGVFLKHIGTGVLNYGSMDVSVGSGGEIIIAEYNYHQISVFSPDGDTLIKIWASDGLDAAQFAFPAALAVSGPYLYVMDYSRVQVFE